MRNTLASSQNPLISDTTLAQSVNWRGQSGRYYTLTQEPLDDFALTSHDLYVVTLGDQAGWTGTAGDIINDQASRTRFRAALKSATAVLRLNAATEDHVERMKIQWDVEGGRMAGALSLVC